MSKSWAVTLLVTEKDDNYIADRTVVYADNQIEATRLGQEALGADNVDVQEIPDADIPTDQEINDLQEYLRSTMPDENTVDEMRGAGGQAYG
jgi:hypothetical protein